jgi:D-3-phosphoglycerate dehydrogenase
MAKIDLKDCHLLVTATSFGSFDAALKRTLEEQVGRVTYNPTGKPLSAAELTGMIGDVDGYIAGLDEITAGVIEAAGKLKVIARYGVGVNNVDLQAAKRHGVVVTNTPGANASAVAELTVSLMLALIRSLLPVAAATRQGSWPRNKGVSLENKVVGLIGFGNIGREVARKLAGFDCKLLAFDVAPDAAAAERLGVTITSMEEVIAGADILSLHCSLVPETRKLIDARRIGLMKDGAYLVNTARGELVDEAALLGALESGRLAGAALDVFSPEPPDPANPLLQHPRVIATPHTGSHTDSAANNMGWGALRNCLAVLRGEEPPDRVV